MRFCGTRGNRGLLIYKGKKNDVQISSHPKTTDRKRNKGFITYPKAKT